jgi:hypothetical protein
MTDDDRELDRRGRIWENKDVQAAIRKHENAAIPAFNDFGIAMYDAGHAAAMGALERRVEEFRVALNGELYARHREYHSATSPIEDCQFRSCSTYSVLQALAPHAAAPAEREG